MRTIRRVCPYGHTEAYDRSLLPGRDGVQADNACTPYKMSHSGLLRQLVFQHPGLFQDSAVRKLGREDESPVGRLDVGLRRAVQDLARAQRAGGGDGVAIGQRVAPRVDVRPRRVDAEIARQVARRWERLARNTDDGLDMAFRQFGAQEAAEAILRDGEGKR